ncbi:excalibur calcium-binding domain-containing protein [Kibdelosporangium persicum]|uniref:excalibur calcium-binding domain-containing protein n=1 Tax=Kibdelosporangium persicum TaxID=2698649 RepID=UPI0015666387|nr:excalibur calcium-binding domain-containing protein [Kibdelosporangium persicum]
MGGRPWHWIAAGTAAVAVVGAVLMNDPSGVNRFRSQPFATVDHVPEVGSPIIATPTLDATTISQATSAPPPAATPTNAQPRQRPPSAPPSRNDPPDARRWTITITVPRIPVYFPNCHTARLLGAAPMHRGHPGYREELDNDRDGVACER